MRGARGIWLWGVLATVFCVFGATAADKDKDKEKSKKSDKKELPAVESGVLGQSVEVTAATLSLNDAIVVASRASGAQIALLPELSDPDLLKKELNFPVGTTSLRNLLDNICMQIGGRWQLMEDGKTINIGADRSPVRLVEKDEDPLKSKFDLISSGIPLAVAIDGLKQASGLNIVCAPNIREIPLEMSLSGWDIERILNHICFMYELEMSKDKDGTYSLKKK